MYHFPDLIGPRQGLACPLKHENLLLDGSGLELVLDVPQPRLDARIGIAQDLLLVMRVLI